MALPRSPLSAVAQPRALEERLEALSHALDELLSRGGCTQCGVCRKHAEMQEEHSRRMDSLEQLLLGMKDPQQGPPGAKKEKRWPPLSREGAGRTLFFGRRQESERLGAAQYFRSPRTSGGREEAGETRLKKDTLRVGTHHTEEPHVRSTTYRALLGSALTDHGPDELRATPPGAPNLAPEMLLGGTVSEATKEGRAFSLQRIQEPEVAHPLVKADTASPGSPTAQGQQPQASGIQIWISPPVGGAEVQDRPRSPPRTCYKVIDDDPPGPAPFPHRIVSLRPGRPCDSLSIDTQGVLGGGRFGRVHKCTENASGLKLAAKVIAARSAKEKEMALNEIQVMNQLSHANIIQLYDAFESKNEVVLVMEYLEGGELFERIVDERSPLTEVDAIIFLKQICQAIQYMHQMYVLHLDLKPENILCVNRTGHQVKIIDFGLARRYKPREKLRVSFGTPEFLAPEIVNFDFVSFPTDMWTVGVVTYMLLSGLSPFLGDDDSETLNNVLTVNWAFDDEAFEHVSDEAKDFVSNLLIRERSGRLSASQCLKHPWLCNISEKAKRSNITLKSQVQLKKYMARRLWKKNYIVVAAANRFKKISSCGSLTSLGI
ncbi:myosin light chain kinase 2, skeletal/cardiac muscle [Scleropages formosus]|uniref:myosin light chain kinase 2, skeletal/cardiac muscle n=1 Tax=Scleropages formosus TaxID=113540 RepID=UPI0010FACB4B|nr:myosin light chain kinase family member 4-like [Scleropages formosus]